LTTKHEKTRKKFRTKGQKFPKFWKGNNGSELQSLIANSYLHHHPASIAQNQHYHWCMTTSTRSL